MPIIRKKSAEAEEIKEPKKTRTKKVKTEAEAEKAEPKKTVRAAKKPAIKLDVPAVLEKKTRSRKAAAPEVKVYVEYQDRQSAMEDIVAAIRTAWTGEEIRTLDVYVKPEDGAAYYVINGSENGKIDL